jgi:hypothetical protein
MYRVAVAVGAGAIAAFAVAVVRFAHFEVWAGAALALATCSALLAAIARLREARQ